MYLISIYFDDNTNKILNRHIERIAEITGNDFMVANNVPPHITVSSIEAKSADVLLPYFEKACQKLTEGPVNIVSTGQLFPYVMYAMPVLNEYLQGMATTIYEALEDVPETKVSAVYKPYSWLPHITLGKTLDKIQMQKAFSYLQEAFSPIKGKIIEIGLAKTNPHEDVARFGLPI